MSRYFYYLIAVNMISNVVALVPRMLLDYRKDGAVPALLVAILVGVGFICAFMWCLSKFPKQDISDIYKKHLPKPIAKISLFIFAMSLWSAGCLTLWAFTDIITQFMNPDINPLIVSLFLMGIAIYTITLPTNKILYFVELLLLLILPLVIIIFLKAFGARDIDWEQVQAGATYVAQFPSPMAVIISTYTFTGYINMLVFNKVFKKISMPKYWWAIGFVGFGNLFTTFFIPIGFHGIDGVGDFVYPWVATADSIRLEYGFVERVIFIFILAYIGIALTSIVIHWHGARITFENILRMNSKSRKKQKKLRTLLLSLFVIFSLAGEMTFDDRSLLLFAKNWMVARFAIEVLVIFSLYYIIKVKKK